MLNAIIKYDWEDWGSKIGLLSVSLIFTSNFVLPESLGVTRLENIVLPLLCVAILAIGDFKADKSIVYSLLALFVVSVFSNFLNLKGVESYVNSIRFIKYILLYLLSGHLIKKHGETVHYIIGAFVIFLIGINLLQIFNPFDIGYELQKIYSNQSQTYELNRVFNRNFRLYGTQNNPNNNAVVWGMIVIYYYIKNLDKKQVGNYIFIFFATVFLFLTQSRTNLVGLVLAFTIYYFFKNLSFKTFARITMIFIAIFFVLSVSGLTYIQQIIVTNPLKIHSLQLRYEVWGSLLDLWLTHPILGFGLETRFEEIIGNAPDNEFLFFLASGGILFAIPYILLFVSTLVVGFNNIKSKNPYYGLYILLPIFLLVNSITNYSFNNVKISLFFFILLGLVNAVKKNIK